MSEAAKSQEEAPLVLREEEGAVALLSLNRPKARNALSIALMEALLAQIEAVGADPAIKAVVLRAEGPAFSAGHDLKEMTARRADEDRGRAFFSETMQLCARMMQAVVNCPKPVIAEVHGIATAAGCQLVASCDLAIASREAKFATPGVNIGLFCSTPMVALSRNVARKHAMEMLLLGEMVTAERAAEIGLINKAVEPGEVHSEAMHMAKIIASKSGLTLAIGKRAFYEQVEKTLPEAYDYAAEVMVRNMLARDAEEGINAFIEKRAPVWEDR